MKILLVEPNYKNKLPPLGLMKISTYHKSKNDEVFFTKGINKELTKIYWDRIYISTVFTFHFQITIKTILYYKSFVSSLSDIYIGGPMATIMFEEFEKIDELKNINIIRGLIDKPGILGEDDIVVDNLTPDYEMISIDKNPYLSYVYPSFDAYFLRSTHGCIRKCVFCAVPQIEPVYCDYLDIVKVKEDIDSKFGEKRYMMMMDNNVLASKNIADIVEDLIKCGFGRNNKSLLVNRNGRTRKLKKIIDFNQGLDARLLYTNRNLMSLLGKIEINPLRVAFDHANNEFIKIYSEVMRMAASESIKSCSNYILFNLDDTPEDLYARLKVNIDLNNEFANKQLSTSIWSFPMKYTPIFGENSKDRKYVGKNWNKKFLRAIQCILIPTHGVVGPKLSYFNHAFGNDIEEFLKILFLPEKFIINRSKSTLSNEIEKFWEDYNSLSLDEKIVVDYFVLDNNKRNIRKKIIESSNEKIKVVLTYYLL